MFLIQEKLFRCAKTLFFVANMLASLFFVCAPPLLVVLLDLLIPSLLLAAAARGPPPSLLSLHHHLKSYRFGTSFLDLPLISAARSLLLLCFYLCWSAKGAYLGLATACAAASAGYVSVRAVVVFGGEEAPAVEALFLSSLTLAIAHVAAAYRSSCRERRKLIVYKIDIEAVSVYNSDFTNYHKVALF